MPFLKKKKIELVFLCFNFYLFCLVLSQTPIIQTFSIKVVDKTSYVGSGNIFGYDEYVPMLDKAMLARRRLKRLTALAHYLLFIL